MHEMVGAHNTTRNLGWFLIQDEDVNEIASWAESNPHMIFFVINVSTELS